MKEPSPISSCPSFDRDRTQASQTLLVCFSHLRWDFVWQRPQHLLTRAAKHYRVIQIEEPLFEDEASPRMDVSTRAGGITIAVPVLSTGLSRHQITECQRELIDRLLAREPAGPRIFWYYTPMALAFTDQLEPDLCVYDNMDELSAFRGASQELIDLESRLFSRADLVFTGGMSLFEAKRDRHHSVHAFPSSIDFDHFAEARRIAVRLEPADQALIPRPRLGFFGVIDERMDLGLLEACADIRPDWQFVMIGPVVKVDPTSLPQRGNIHWLGGKAYRDLPLYLSGWDVGLMPFALNESTRFISPTKTPEFLAAGVPVVSTAIADVIRPYGDEGLVEIAESPLDVVRKAEALLARPKQPWLTKVDRHLAQGSWSQTWAAMHVLMRSRMGETGLTAAARAQTFTPAE